MRHFIICISLCIGQVIAVTGISAQNRFTPALQKLQIAEFAISKLYVDTVNEEKLVEEAIVRMLAKLDPHSTYSDAKEVKKMTEQLQGNFEGIGVQFNMVEDTLFVVQPVSGGPSEKIGILAGDRIVAVNDTAIAGVKMNTEEIMSRLRGPKNSLVKLGVVRRKVNEPLVFSVRRDKIPVFSIDASYIIAPETGYIRVGNFGATTAKEFSKALQELQAKGAKHLILDLQGNGGGYLNASVELANEFLDTGELITYTQGRTSPRSEFTAMGNGKFRQGRVAVLVDEFSASASEIVSGALQDWDRGVVVGRRSFGKGLVQRPIDLPDGSMIRLTVARYYTPSGRCIQKPYENVDLYNKDLFNRYNAGELTGSGDVQMPDSLKYKTNRLQRTVYGGGGITPDYFVPIDTTRYTDYHRKLRDKGIINKVSVKYIDENRTALLKEYKTFEAFDAGFRPSETTLLADMRAMADKEQVEFNQKEYEIALPLIEIQLKALTARDLWTINEYFRVINTVNQSVSKALEVLGLRKYPLHL